MEVVAWVQGIAAVVQAGAAVVVVQLTRRLVGVTSQYVTLTKDLADAARAQQRIQEAEQTKARAQFFALVDELRLQVHRLPGDLAQGEQMRQASIWTAGDLDALTQLGASLGLAEDVTKAATHLRRLAEHVQYVKGINRNLGVSWRDFPWDNYIDHRRGAIAVLDPLSVLPRGTSTT